MRWYGDNLWLFIPMGQKIKEFLVTIPQFPFQEGAGASPANLNYQTLKAMQALKRLETLSNPHN